MTCVCFRLLNSGELKLHVQSIAPGELLEHVVMAYHHQTEQKNIKLNLDVKSNLPEVTIDPGTHGTSAGKHRQERVAIYAPGRKNILVCKAS